MLIVENETMNGARVDELVEVVVEEDDRMGREEDHRACGISNHAIGASASRMHHI